MNKKNIALLFGGASTEHIISCRSVMTFIENIDREKYNPLLIGITKTGGWFLFFGDTSLIPTDEWENSPDKSEVFADFGEGKGLFTIEKGEKRSLDIDVFLPVLHGRFGEDGTIQGLFEMLGIPYVGCGVSASANSMDKSLTKLIVSHAGIKQADYVLVHRHNQSKLDELENEAEEKLGYPIFIKPCASGSSIGICKAHNRAELSNGIKEALKHDSRVLLEKFINARELECAVLETKNGIIAEVGEVISADEFYDFDSKYNNAASVTDVAPRISSELALEIKRQATEIFKILDCRSLSRIDFFLDKDSGELIFNEINTLPGFTSISMYPMLIGKQGYDKKALIDALIDTAL